MAERRLEPRAGGVALHFPHQVRQSHGRSETDQDMRVVRHAMDGQELLALVRYDAGNVFVEFFLVLPFDEVLTALYRKTVRM